jgi:hypothetical protein
MWIEKLLGYPTFIKFTLDYVKDTRKIWYLLFKSKLAVLLIVSSKHFSWNLEILKKRCGLETAKWQYW